MRESVAVAAALHALAGAVLITLTLVPGSAGRRPETKGAAPAAVQVPRIVFLQVPGPGGGGGGAAIAILLRHHARKTLGAIQPRCPSRPQYA